MFNWPNGISNNASHCTGTVNKEGYFIPLNYRLRNSCNKNKKKIKTKMGSTEKAECGIESHIIIFQSRHPIELITAPQKVNPYFMAILAWRRPLSYTVSFYAFNKSHRRCKNVKIFISKNNPNNTYNDLGNVLPVYNFDAISQIGEQLLTSCETCTTGTSIKNGDNLSWASKRNKYFHLAGILAKGINNIGHVNKTTTESIID